MPLHHFSSPRHGWLGSALLISACPSGRGAVRPLIRLHQRSSRRQFTVFSGPLMTSEVGRHWSPCKALTEDGSVPSSASCLWGANFQYALLSSDGGNAERKLVTAVRWSFQQPHSDRDLPAGLLSFFFFSFFFLNRDELRSVLNWD